MGRIDLFMESGHTMLVMMHYHTLFSSLGMSSDGIIESQRLVSLWSTEKVKAAREIKRAALMVETMMKHQMDNITNLIFLYVIILYDYSC